MLAPDTIAAISTPPGRGGIGIVRLDGPEAARIGSALLQVGSPLGAAADHGRARFVRVVDPARAGQTIDDAVVTVFLAPASYTGNTVVEIAAHGSPVVLGAMLRRALELGARLARAGEFTERAFLAGRLDLTQAEAVHDLIAAQTLEQARSAAQQMGGALSRKVKPAKETLLHLIALLEAGMDFASGELDDVEVVPPGVIGEAIEAARTPLGELLRSFRQGQMLREGISLALVGRPNAGKSSLFNRLLERERAIVTATPGTTRDTVEETVSLGGIPVRLIDTAGLRVAGEAAADEAELQGMERSREALADADLVLLVQDASRREGGPLEAEEEAFARGLEGRPHLVVRNKVDLLNSLPEDARGEAVGVATSALTGYGLEALRAAILREVAAEGGIAEGGALNNVRQQEAVAETVSALAAAGEANDAGLPHEVVLLDLHRALRALDSLTGQTTTDDILGRIFSTFCIGK